MGVNFKKIVITCKLAWNMMKTTLRSEAMLVTRSRPDKALTVSILYRIMTTIVCKFYRRVKARKNEKNVLSFKAFI